MLVVMQQLLDAQKFEPKFDHLTSANGLASNTVNAILQDHYGFMWFGTYNGLCKYDGYDFVVYTNSPTNKTTLTDNRISALMEDKDGYIYVGTWDKGLNIYNRQSDGFMRYTHEPNNRNSISSNEILTFFIDSKERIWIGTKNGGLNLFDARKGTFQAFKYDSLHYSERLDVYGISELPNGNLILATRGDGITTFDVNTHQYTLFNNPNKDEDNFSGWEKSLYKDSDGKFWVSAKGSGVFRIDFKTKKVKQFKNNTLDKNSLSSNVATQVLEYGKGRFLITTDGGGLNCFDSSTEMFKRFTNDNSDLNSISSNGTYSLYADSRNILWVGTFGGGVNIYDPNKEKFTTYKPNPADPNSLSHRSVLAIFQDDEENIWIGTDGGGLNLYNPKLYGENFIHFKHDPLDPSSLVTDVVKSIYKDSKGSIWLGTWNEGLEQFNPKTGKFIHHIADPNDSTKIMSNSTWSIIEDDEANLWFAQLGRGVDVLNLNSGKFRHYIEGDGPRGLPHRNIMALYLDSKKRIWLGTEGGGLLLYQKESDSFIKFRNDTADHKSLSSDDVRTIFEDSSGKIWVGTQAHGLNLLDESTGTFTIFTENDGMVGNAVYGILEDKENNLWISTTKGISKFNYAAKTFTNYSKLDGLIDADFNYAASLKAKDGRFYFGGLNGFNAFFPENISINQLKPKAFITNLKLFNQDVVPGDNTNILEKPISECSEIEVAHNQSVLTIQYTGINYTFSVKNQFAYRLENFDKEWNYVKSKREATYTNLDPGEYIFRVKVSNNDGVWNEVGTSLKIIVLPPYWATWWFRILVILIVSLSIYVYIKLRIRSVEKQRNMLKQMVDERTKELNEVNGELYLLNRQLSEVNILLEETNEEISQQKEQLVFQNEEISQQKDELERHRNHLEELVEERTDELLSAKEKAEESERLKASFLANMSHEIRTPLNAIVGFSNLLTLQDNSPEEVADFTSHINRNTEDLLVLIDDILDLSALEAKQSKRIDSTFNVLHFVTHFYKNWESHKQTEAVKINLVNNVTNPRLNFVTDEHKMRQILSNLMSNACKFTEKGSVTLTFDHRDGEYVFSVRDTGIGIAAKNLDIIFERFRKVEDHRDKLFRGNGLGLAISLRLAELLGGNLWAESELGKGSIFYFSIPEEVVK